MVSPRFLSHLMLLLLLCCLAACGARAPTDRPPLKLSPAEGAQRPPSQAVAQLATDRQAAAPGSQPTKWGIHLLLDDGTRQWPVEVWDEHLAYARQVVGAGGFVVELVRANDLDLGKWQG